MSQSMTAAGQATQPGINLLQPWSPAQIQANDNASKYLRSPQVGKRFTQQIYQTNFVPVSGQPFTVTVPVNPVGLITKFWAVVSTVVTNPGGGATLNLTPWGPWNTFSLITYTDPNTNNRIQTTGAHLSAVAARRHRRVPGAAVTTDSPASYGSVMTPVSAPATIAAGANGTVNALYEIPLTIGRHSLKGAVFAGAVFATQTLQFTFNPQFAGATANANTQLQVYGNAAASPNNPTYATTVTVFQEFWDQFPLALLNFLSPDLSTVYELKTTAITALLANNDNYVRFNNLRQFFSTLLTYYNGTNAPQPGTDVNYFLLQSANQTTEWKRPPALQSYMTRNLIGDDYPTSNYMFDFSEAPIITAAEGNTVLSINPSVAAAGAVLYIGWEDIATSAVLASASSLSGNAGVG